MSHFLESRQTGSVENLGNLFQAGKRVSIVIMDLNLVGFLG